MVLRGAGGHFSAGLDLQWLRGLGDIPAVADLQRGLADFQAAVLAVVRCPVPVLAVVEGTAAGFGLDLALACDLRLASRDASFTSAFARMGLIPDGGSTFTLPRLVGIGPALRLLLAGETIDAARALAIGLVGRGGGPGAARRGGRGDSGQAYRRRHVAASARSSGWSARRRSARSSRCSRTEGAAQLQALQGPEFRRRLEAFTAKARRPRGGRMSPAGAAGTHRGTRLSARHARRPCRARHRRGHRDRPRHRVVPAAAGRRLGRDREPQARAPRAGGRAAARARRAVSTVETNVREPEAVARMVERVTAEHGRIDILVNNAAGNFYAPSASLSPNAWRAVVETDLYGSFYCAQAVYPGHEGAGRRPDRLDLDDPALSRLAAHGARDGGQGRRGRA